MDYGLLYNRRRNILTVNMAKKSTFSPYRFGSLNIVFSLKKARHIKYVPGFSRMLGERIV